MGTGSKGFNDFLSIAAPVAGYVLGGVGGAILGSSVSSGLNSMQASKEQYKLAKEGIEAQQKIATMERGKAPEQTNYQNNTNLSDEQKKSAMQRTILTRSKKNKQSFGGSTSTLA